MAPTTTNVSEIDLKPLARDAANCFYPTLYDVPVTNNKRQKDAVQPLT